MDLWSATDKQIMDIAEKRSGREALSVYRPSGYWAWVTMADRDTGAEIVYLKELLETCEETVNNL